MDKITIIYDLETTGFKCMPMFSRYHKVIQICAHCIETDTLFDAFVDPGFDGDIPYHSTRVNNIKRSDVVGADKIDVVLRNMYNFFDFNKYATVELIAHNNDKFDHPVIMKEYKSLCVDEVPTNVVFWDTLPWFRSYYPKLEKYDLESLHIHFFMEKIDNAHRADADVAALSRLYVEAVAPHRTIGHMSEEDLLFDMVYRECLTSINSIGPGRAFYLYNEEKMETVSDLMTFAKSFLLRGDKTGFDRFLKEKIRIGNVTARMNVISRVYELPIWFDEIFDFMTIDRAGEDCIDETDYFVKYRYVLNKRAPNQQVYQRGLIRMYNRDDW
jgi:DNA polymerase III epsilon subunit-like protein